jgi:hypothetical protein
MNAPASQQEIVDAEHLKLLRIGYYISAATNIIWVFFPLIYVFMGGVMLFGGFDSGRSSDNSPRGVGLAFIFVGLGISLIMAVLSALKLLTAQAIGQRKWKGLIFATAIISSLAIPWGTALGVFTLLVLSRPSVEAQFTGVRQPPYS